MLSSQDLNNGCIDNIAARSQTNLPVSHLLPMYPAGQVQLYELIPSTHVAPFLHGRLAQSSMSEVRTFCNVGGFVYSKTLTVLCCVNTKVECNIAVK